MNLTITQDNTRTETINSSIIDKLYEIAFAASSDPNSTVSLTGRLESPKGYKYKIDWLNAEFSPDLTITVPASGLYMVFYDSAVENILKTSIGDGNGVGILSVHDLQDLNSLGFVNNTDITDFREGVLFDNASIATSAGFVNGCTNLDVVGVPPYLTRWNSQITYGCAPHKIVISNWNNWLYPILVANGQGLCYIKHDLCTLNADNTLSVVTNINLPEGVDFPSGHLMFGGFYNSTINTVNIPTTVTRLNSFLYSDILTITFTQGSTLSSIEEYCFYDCTSLALNVSNLPQTLTKINDQAFRSCSNVTGVLDLPNLTTLGESAFQNTKITSVTDLGSISSIPNGCFLDCTALTSVTLPSTCISLNNLTFGYCNSLTDINLSNVKSIGYKCFDTCNSLTNINLSSLINYGQDSFVNCGNISITLPSLSINSGSLGMFGGNTRLLNVYGSVENWTTIHRNFPKFSDISSGIDVLYFKNATSIYAPKFGVNSQFGDEVGLCTTSNSNVGTKAMYVPKLQEISCGITSIYNRLASVFGIGVQLHIGGDRLKIDLLYFKDLLEIKSSPFGGLLCNALVINKSVPPTITPLTYSTISEYTTSVNNVKVNAWGELEDATDPNATITGTTTWGWDYSLTKKLRHTPYITAIYVPDSAVNTYKTTTGWISVANLILPISNLNSGIVYATLLDWETAGKPVGLIAECLDLSTADLATFMLDNNLTYWTNPNA